MQLVDGISIDYSGLPELHRDALRAYIEFGIMPGSCLTAALSNNLRAVVMADVNTLQDLPKIYRWLVNHAPSQAWGSPEKVVVWSQLMRTSSRLA